MQLLIFYTNIDMFALHNFTLYVLNMEPNRPIEKHLLPSYNPTTCRLSRELDMIVIVPIVVHELNGP
jgi:hypothetical protein